MKSIDASYRLGNIIDAWYGSRSHLDEMTRNFPDTFGKFLVTFPVEKKPDIPLGEYWWQYFTNIKRVIVPLQESLRKAIDSYFSNKYQETDLRETCIIHLRLGDFLHMKETFHYENIIKALDKLPVCPRTIEILNGGKYHFSTSDALNSSNQIIEKLETSIREKFPNTEVIISDSTDADLDFYKLTKAPMIITGLGSFAIFAAVANRNFRLTPSFEVLHHEFSCKLKAEHVIEGWFTYEPL